MTLHDVILIIVGILMGSVTAIAITVYLFQHNKLTGIETRLSNAEQAVAAGAKQVGTDISKLQWKTAEHDAVLASHAFALAIQGNAPDQVPAVTITTSTSPATNIAPGAAPLPPKV